MHCLFWLLKKATFKEIASLVLNNRVLLKASKEMNFLFCVPAGSDQYGKRETSENLYAMIIALNAATHPGIFHARRQ